MSQVNNKVFEWFENEKNTITFDEIAEDIGREKKELDLIESFINSKPNPRLLMQGTPRLAQRYLQYLSAKTDSDILKEDDMIVSIKKMYFIKIQNFVLKNKKLCGVTLKF